MIKIVYEKDVITISGHANYANYGNDIVCASVSSVLYTTVNAILHIDASSIAFVDDKKMQIRILEHKKIVDILIQNMMDILSDLTIQYPKNIKIVKGE